MNYSTVSALSEFGRSSGRATRSRTSGSALVLDAYMYMRVRDLIVLSAQADNTVQNGEEEDEEEPTEDARSYVSTRCPHSCLFFST